MTTTSGCCCCCAPYPIINLTEAFKAPHTTNPEVISSIKEQILAACERYGCFHVVISPADLNESANLHHFMDEKVVREHFNRIFRSRNTVLSDYDSQAKENEAANDKDSIVAPFRTVDGHVSAARYRGRAAESGSPFGLEPKQSWEVFRCQGMIQPSSGAPYKDDLAILHEYMKVLHKVSVCILSTVLGLSLFVDSSTCECQSRRDDKSSFCSVDLLRAFQYDALDSNEILHNLGSSPHTDWGALTVVWQDSKGGLQIYCHEHQKWNDVQIMDDNQDTLIRFFIHVGDFTSLAMNATKNNTLEGLCWPSPLHRVLCPVKDDSQNCLQSESSRCSLVYFAYPAKGVSLKDVQDFTEKHDCVDQSKNVGFTFPYERYMVLRDQSDGVFDSAAEAKKVYGKIVSVPFHEVIQEKWKQVQR